MAHKQMNIAYEIGQATDRGRKRIGKPNQDSLVVLTPSGKQSLPPVLIVADGMGGYTGGEVASRIIIETFAGAYQKKPAKFEFREFCDQALAQAHKKMQEKAETDSEFAGMGSTIVMASIDQGVANIMNVGDSRAYLLHEGELKQVNYDHSFVGEAVRAGLITPAEAMVHPKKNQLTQSVSARRVEIKPYFNQVPFGDNDLILLCSDGLWGVVAESMIQAVVSELSSQAAAEKLVKLANSRGGPDNISVIVFKKAGARLSSPEAEAD